MAEIISRGVTPKEKSFCKYFFYGLDNMEDVIKGIIAEFATEEHFELRNQEMELFDKRKKEEFSKPKIKKELVGIQNKIDETTRELNSMKQAGNDEEEINKKQSEIYALQTALYNRKNEIERSVEGETIVLDKQMPPIVDLIIQLERFKTLNDGTKYFFEEKDKERAEVQEKIKEEFQNLNRCFSFVDYAPLSGIYCSPWVDQNKENWVQEIISVLKDLIRLEKEDKFQYYSAFLDSKYSRAINRREQEITKDDKEICEIRKVYRKFLERAPISGRDIINGMGDINNEMVEYVEKKYPMYDTITPLKKEAQNNTYLKRVEAEIRNIKQMFQTKPIDLQMEL